MVVLIAATASAFAWFASLVSKDTSWVDRLWSIVPVMYVWVFTISAGMQDTRLNVIAVLVTIWGARLTFNFARKGGYTGVEDYRWAVLRARMTGWQFQLFNLFFIVIYQMALILLMTLGAWTAYEHQGTPFGLLDVLLTIAFIGCLVGETVADQQQWVFHRAKHAGGADFRPRFLTTGLFRFSRHPNYFFEQAQWWLVFGFGAVAADRVFTARTAQSHASTRTAAAAGEPALPPALTRQPAPARAAAAETTARSARSPLGSRRTRGTCPS